MMSKALLAGGAVCGAATAALAVAFIVTPEDAFAECRLDNSVDYASLGAPFSLIDETGATVSDADVFTEPTLLYLGYTFCPDVCPMDNMRNAEAVAQLRDQGTLARTVFLSIDPERDTPDVLAYFTDNFDEDMLGLTGPSDAVAEVAAAYRAYVGRQEAADDEFYLIDHSTHTYVVLPEYGVVDIIGRAEAPHEAAERLSCHISKA